jgi:hypothetical protein
MAIEHCLLENVYHELTEYSQRIVGAATYSAIASHPCNIAGVVYSKILTKSDFTFSTAIASIVGWPGCCAGQVSELQCMCSRPASPAAACRFVS